MAKPPLRVRYRRDEYDGTQIVAYKWEPEDDRGPRAAVQLTHGMGEHALRYGHVAQA
jgi:alpha-beta hydrolase superfamily lysophospholipase